MGTEASVPVRLVPPREIRAVPRRGGSRDVFGDIADDIVGPVRSIVDGALNEFKGPVQEIVHFVVSNLLSGLIKFIAESVMDIFPGVDGIEEDGKRILGGMGSLVPAAALVMRESAEEVAGRLEGVVGGAREDIGAVVGGAAAAFGELRALSEEVGRGAKGILADAAALFDGTADLAVNLAGGAGTGSVAELDRAVTAALDSIRGVPAGVLGALGEGTSDLAALFVGLSNDILAPLRAAVAAIGAVTGVVVRGCTAQVGSAGDLVKSAVSRSAEDALGVIRALKEGAVGLPGVGTRMLGTTLEAAREAEVAASRAMRSGAAEAKAVTAAASSAAVTISGAVDRAAGLLSHAGVVLGVAIVLVFAFVLIMARRDLVYIRSYR